MRITVLGSGSRGNAIFVESDAGALLIDAGFSFREMLKRCEAAGRDPAREWSVPVAGSAGTLEAVRPALATHTETVLLPPARGTQVGDWRITAFPSAHDARDPVVLVAEDPRGRRIGVAYDVGSPTVALRHAIRGLDALVIESNHDEVMLRGSEYPPSVRARIAGRAGHLSNEEAARLVADAAHSRLGLVVLAHLSERCNEQALALETMKAALHRTAFAGRVIVATQDAPTETVELAQTLQQLALPL